MTGFHSFDESSALSLAAILRPQAQARTVVQFARTVKLPDGPKQGEYLRPETEPAQWHFLQARLSGKWSTFVYCAPSQRGKTLIAILLQWLYAICEERLSVGYVMPNLDKMQQNWEGKIKPAIVGAGFGPWLPVKGPGSKGGKPAALTMTDPDSGRSAVTYFMAGGSGARETSLSSVSPARLVIDEADDFEDAGHIQLALKRLESWGKKAQAFIASTVNNRTNRTDHPILDWCNRADATRTRIAHKCPHCEAYQIVRFEQLNLEKARIACQKCGVLWAEDDRHLALRESKMVHGAENLQNHVVLTDERQTSVFSLLTTGFDYLMADMRSIADTYKVAKDKEALGDYSLAENFSHKILCEPYTIPVDHESITDRALALRSAKSATERGFVPDWCDRIVVAVDVQADRCYWMVVGSGSSDRRCIIDNDEWFWTPKNPQTGRGMEPTDEDRHMVLDRVRQKALEGWPKYDGTVIKASLVGIDIGYNVGGGIGKWCAGKAGVIPLRGDGERRQQAETIEGKKLMFNLGIKHGTSLEADYGFYEIRKQETAGPGQPVHWWFVKTQQLREHLAARLRREVDSEGSMMLYQGVAERDPLSKHLSAWAITRDPDTKLTKWVQVGRRDDYNDCACYALAMLTIKPRQRTAGGKITSKEVQ